MKERVPGGSDHKGCWMVSCTGKLVMELEKCVIGIERYICFVFHYMMEYISQYSKHTHIF